MAEGFSAPPPSYNAVMQNVGSFSMSFVDFTPALLKAAGFVSSPEYERFDVLMSRANEWLQQNPAVKVKTCESIEVKLKVSGDVAVDTTRSAFTEWGAMCYVRCLRLWIIPTGPSDSPEPQRISYINAVPACIDAGGVFSQPKFASYGDTLQELNQRLKNNPLQGHILNVETQDMKFKTWGNKCDPDKSYWYEYGKETVFYLNVIRVFYEIGEPAYEEIGAADFIPSRTQQDGLFKAGEFESLHEVVGKARHWVSQQPHLNVLNVQSMDYKLKQGWSGESLDSQRSMYYELGKGITYYIRIVRLIYTISHRPGAQVPRPFTLSYRTFLPCQTTMGGTFSEPDFELQTESMKRIMAWLTATGARVLSVETITVRMYSGHQHGNAEKTYTYNPGNRAERHLFAIRVYLDGDYAEPRAEALPPPPVITESSSDGCCIVL